MLASTDSDATASRPRSHRAQGSASGVKPDRPVRAGSGQRNTDTHAGAAGGQISNRQGAHGRSTAVASTAELPAASCLLTADHPFASFQFSPTPTSTVRAPTAARRPPSPPAPAPPLVGLVARHLEQQFVVDGQDHPRAAAACAPVLERPVDVDHRPLQDVRRGSLDRQVDRHPLGGRRAPARSGLVSSGTRRRLSEQRLHDAGSAAPRRAADR